MSSIIFVLPDGNHQIVDVDAGENVMRAALSAGVPGIMAECGGACVCATCHVYVAPESTTLLSNVSDVENEMLECTAADRLDTSRLSCQLIMPPNVTSLTIRIPDNQL